MAFWASLHGVMNNKIIDIPIGGIIPFHINMTGADSLPINFIACNGQSINDIESPLHGQTAPQLNGSSDETMRFIRVRNNTSGGRGGSVQHNHTFPSGLFRFAYWRGTWYSSNLQGLKEGTGRENPERRRNIRPPFVNVRFIMRIK